jgi:lipoyl(octanoyl) transferase
MKKFPLANLPVLKFVPRVDLKKMHMDDSWRYIQTPPAHGAWNMAVDEALLETSGRGESLPALRLYAWRPACLSLGYAQSYRDVDLDRLKYNGWELVRRATGGRAILHTDELTYSIAAPPDEPRMFGTVLESYQRLAQALMVAVRTLGLPVEMESNSPPADAARGPVCFEVPSAYEIVVDGKKLIGSAQTRKKTGILQHGSFPLSGDLTRITQALVFPDEQARLAAGQKLLSRAVTAETVTGQIIPWETAAAAFVAAFESTLGIHLAPGELTSAERARADELVKNKYDHADWTERS